MFFSTKMFVWHCQLLTMDWRRYRMCVVVFLHFIMASKNYAWSHNPLDKRMRFYQLFFRLTGLEHKLLLLIESPNFIGNQPKKVKVVWSLGQNLGQIWFWCGKNKETGISVGFFSYFAWVIHLAWSSGYRNTRVKIES